MDPASASLRVIRALSKADDVPRGVIRAYHGSPYSFDRFDASKIGTGTGRGDYGHGFYFSESEPLAETYRSGASAMHRTPEEDALELWRRNADRLGDPKLGVLAAIDSAEESMNAAGGMWMAQQRWDDILQHLYGIDYRSPLPKRPGSMLEVELGVPKESLLDYNSPFMSPAGASASQVLESVAPGSIPTETLRGIQDSAARGDRLTLRGDNGERGKAAILIRKLAKSPAGAEALRDAGIPGIRYVDDSLLASKGIGPATNYVMFPGTEERIRILRQYGLLPPLVGAAAMEEE
jgi:hypothetical protein